jgi:hypothetical protein
MASKNRQSLMLKCQSRPVDPENRILHLSYTPHTAITYPPISPDSYLKSPHLARSASASLVPTGPFLHNLTPSKVSAHHFSPDSVCVCVCVCKHCQQLNRKFVSWKLKGLMVSAGWSSRLYHKLNNRNFIDDIPLGFGIM